MKRSVERIRAPVAQEILDDSEQRLRNTRWSPEIGNADWSYRANGQYLRDLVAYWRNDFDWRRQEAEINRFAHFKVQLRDSVPVHFIHEKGRRPKAVISRPPRCRSSTCRSYGPSSGVSGDGTQGKRGVLHYDA